MAKQVGKKFAWVIKNFSSSFEKCYSVPVQIGDCKWRLSVNTNVWDPNYLSLNLEVTDFESLPCGWRKYVNFRLTVVRQATEEQPVMKESSRRFEQKQLFWGFPTMISFAKLRDVNENFCVNGEIIIVAEVDVLQVIGTSEKSVETNPLKKLKVESASSTSSQRHQEIAVEFRARNQHLKTSCMNFLLSLTQTLFQTPQELSVDDLVEADNALAYMGSSGVAVDWLKKRLDEVKEMKKDELSD